MTDDARFMSRAMSRACVEQLRIDTDSADTDSFAVRERPREKRGTQTESGTRSQSGEGTRQCV